MSLQQHLIHTISRNISDRCRRARLDIWDGYEYGFVERPAGFDEGTDADGDGIFSIEEQKAAREKKAAEVEADATDNPLAQRRGMTLGDSTVSKDGNTEEV